MKCLSHNKITFFFLSKFCILGYINGFDIRLLLSGARFPVNCSKRGASSEIK